MTRTASLFDSSVIPVSLSPDLNGSRSYLEASIDLVDIMDASRGEEGVILVNAAPRSGKAKKWPNGTPFGYFYYKNVLVCSSIDGGVLSLARKLNLVDKVYVWDIPEVMDYANKMGLVGPKQAEYIKDTQFRSFEFLPRVAKWTWDKIDLPTEEMTMKELSQDFDNTALFVDNFGNIKTSILPEEIGFEHGKVYKLSNGMEVVAAARLKDVPNGEPGLIVGSSGIKDQRLVELVVQGQSAEQITGLTVGDKILAD